MATQYINFETTEVLTAKLEQREFSTQYMQGSFRDVPFFIESHEFESGRRKQDNEWIKKASSEDRGQRIRKYQLEVYVLGPDYMTERNKLVEALEEEGPAYLVHPYFGQLYVQAGKFTLTENKNEGGYCVFNIAFIEVTLSISKDRLSNKQNKFYASLSTANKSLITAKNSIKNGLSFINKTTSEIEKVTEEVETLTENLDGVINAIVQPTEELTFAIGSLKDAVKTLANRPEEYTDRLEYVFDSFMNEIVTTPSYFDDGTSMLSNSFTSFFYNLQSNLYESINSGITLMTVAKYAVIVLDISRNGKFTSKEEAEVIKNKLTGELDKLLANEDVRRDESLTKATKELKYTLVDNINADNILIYETARVLPTVVLSYILYGDISREQELINLNKIKNPLRVPAGRIYYRNA